MSTTATNISSTVSAEVINNLPVVTRNAMNFVTFLPGVETPGTGRASTINGLPQSTINVTIDGVTTSNLLQSGDGFFSMITPRLDAVQEVTVSGAGAGAESGGGGAVQIKFVTRSGTNQFDGSIYHFFRHPTLNTNYFFNEVNGLDRNRVIVHTYGGRVGGPIVIPGLVDGRGKAFFFSNFEHFHQPTEASRTRTILSPEAQGGVFEYDSATLGRQTINVLALAATNGQVSAVDPTVATILNNIRTAMGTTGTTAANANTLATLSYFYQAESTNNQMAPTNSVDINLSQRHRLKGTYYLQRFKSRPDLLNNSEGRFPGFANFGNQDSYRTTGSITLRSTLGSGFVNEVLGGWQHSPNDFFGNINAGMFEDQGGFALNFPLVTDPFTRTDSAPRNTPNWNIDNNMSWLKGSHSFTFGGSFTQVINTLNNRNAVPTLDITFNTTLDPAAGLFTTANFPGATNAQLGDARSIYALLTGRVTQVNGVARLNEAGDQYVYLGNGLRRSKGNGLAAYIQDSWRMKSNFTLNYGVRWEALFPFNTITDNYTVSTMTDLCGPSGLGSGVGGRECNLFQPNSFNNPGQVPTYVPYHPKIAGIKTSWFDFGPNVGAAWRPNVQSGWLRSLLGDPEQATLRGVFALQFNRPRIDAFENRYGANPGLNVPGGATRGTAAGQYPLLMPGETYPVFLSQTSRLGPPAFVQTPSYPITASLTAGNDVNVIDSDIQTPYTLSWSVGLQRSLGSNTAFEVRYVGNKNATRLADRELERREHLRERVPRRVQGGAGQPRRQRGGEPRRHVRLHGPGHRHHAAPDLPGVLQRRQPGQRERRVAVHLHELHEHGRSPRISTGTRRPRATAAADLWTNNAAFRTNAAAAGLPSNFFVLNPLVDDANITRSTSGQGSRYHSLQFDLRRRLAQGLLANVNYTFARTFNSNQVDLHEDPIFLQSSNVPHALKTTFSYEIPVGRGKRFGTDMNSALNAVIGNWEFSGTGRVQWRAFVFRGKMFGMSQAELQDNFKIRFAESATGTTQVFIMPQDIIDNTRRAFNTDEKSVTGYGPDGPPTGRYLAPASSPGCIVLYSGDCGQEEIWVRGPSFVRFDVTFKKRIPFGRKASFDIQFDLLNAFDNVNFTQVFNPGGGNDIFQVTQGYTDINGTFDPGGRLGQVVWRLNF